MTTPFSYTTTYILDKSHFSETFDESVIIEHSIKVYSKAIALGFLGGAILFLTEIDPYAGWFLIALSALEALSIRFRKPWWLARQMMSKAANTELTLSINEHSVCSQSFHVNSKILWADIDKIEQTTQGWLLCHGTGRNYLSGRCLSDEAKDFIRTQALLKAQIAP